MALKIGISGKRNIIDTDKDDLAAKIKSSIDEILKKHNSNEFIGYTSLAIGADTIFADIVTTEFKMPLVIILPFDEAEYTKDFTTTTDRDNLGKYLADNKHTIEIATTKSPANDDERSEAYFEAGKVIVKDCDEMIFVWDECKPNGKAGTAEVMGYFRETRPGKKEVVINVTAFKTDWLYNEIDAQYEQVNNLAMENRDHYKKIWTLSIGLGWTVVFIFALNTIFHLEPKIELPHWIYQVAAILELGFVVRVFLLIESAKKNNYHGNYLSNRLTAEKLRLLKCFYQASIVANLTTFIAKGDKELSGIIGKINYSIRNAFYRSKWYSSYAIKSLIIEQQDYHTRKIKEIESKMKWPERITWWAKTIFLINLCVHLIFAVAESALHGFHTAHFLERTITFLNIILPATYAAAEGTLYFHEWKKLKKHSESALHSFEKVLLELPAVTQKETDLIDFTHQSTSLNSVANVMLADNKGWYDALENKNNYTAVL